MMSRLRNTFRSEAGFTLIELLVVIAVLGILAGIAVPRLGGVKDRAAIATGNSALGTINTAMGLFHAENDTYPTDPATVGADLGTYIDNLDDVLGDWSIIVADGEANQYVGTADTFDIAITDGTNTLTMDETGDINEV